ncbi:centromere protein M isoform X2 [Grammomys surdaster]|uniref:centromere protein M isoform X2 n=1 Tax=Grammomys surdaster TaxID=491861 RepID=UPI0010A0BF40|nr:centromere protein M isoform X2 [Grammomys surdaster]
MSVLRPMEKLPDLNRATVLLVSTEDALLQQLAESMLKGDCASELRVHLANSLPLPSNVNRPRIDLIVFVINLHSKYSLQKVEESLNHVDSHFFLGKVCFLVTGGGKLSSCHGAAPGARAADLRWPRAGHLSAQPAVLAEEPREPPVQGAVSTAAVYTFGANSISSHRWRRPVRV